MPRKGEKISSQLREAIKASNVKRRGYKHSAETRKKLSEVRIGRFSLENHPMWKGGKSFEKYPVNWTQTLRMSIRERDRYTCHICHSKQGDKAFDVHHIDYNKRNCDPSNLITLCKPCHTRTNSNREDWQKFFQDSILKP